MLRKFASYYKNHLKLFTLDISCAFLMSGIDLLLPFFIKEIVDRHFPEENFNMINKILLLLLGLYILRFILHHIVHYWGHIVGIRMENDMRRELFSHLQTLSFKFYDDNKVGYLLSRITNDLLNISELAHHGPEDLFISLVMLGGSFIILLNTNWQLALFTFAMIPIMLLISLKLRKKIKHSFKDVKENLSLLSSQIEDNLSGIRVVQSFTNEEFEIDKFDHINQRYSLSREKTMRVMADFFSSMYFLNNMIILTTLGMGSYLISKKSLSPGELMAFLFYIKMFMEPIKKLIGFNEQFQQGMAGFERFTQLLDVKADIVSKTDAIELKNITGNITYKDVSFGYDHHSKVFNSINLEIKTGETVAFVGPSGAGKTTLCQLLPRFYDIDNGQILIDNQDISDLSISSLRQNIGIVQQDVFLFNGTIRDNLAYGNLDATNEDIIIAAKKANAHEFIMALEDGYDTHVGEKGVKLSGGQKQRISIARSFLKNPPILILDEATSALDNQSEKIIQASLKKLAEGRTTLVIAHRLSTIRDADKIAVITEDGIAEVGNHEELLGKDTGVYKKLYESQFEK